MPNLRPPTTKLIKDQIKIKISNFGLFYKYKDEKSHLVPPMRKYWSVDI